MTTKTCHTWQVFVFGKNGKGGTVKIDLSQTWGRLDHLDRGVDVTRGERQIVRFKGFDYLRYTNPDGSKGGLVDLTCTVADTVYIGPKARVAGFCKLTDHVRLEGSAYVCGASHLHGNVVVRGKGSVYAGCRLYDHTLIEGMADGVTLTGRAFVPQGERLTKEGTKPLRH